MKAALRRIILRILWRAVDARVKRDQPYCIAVTGSAGKTSTKEAIACILEASGRPVVKTSGNLATDTGIPISLLGFQDRAKTVSRWASVLFRAVFLILPKRLDHPYYVLELSSDTKGDLALLASHFPICAAVYTTAGQAHMEQYGTEEVLVEELMTLLPYVREGGYVVVNADDQTLRANVKPSCTTYYYGIPNSSRRIRNGVWGVVQGANKKGLIATVQYGAGLVGNDTPVEVEVQTKVIGKHQLYPVLAALAVAAKEGIPVKAAVKQVSEYHIPNGRGRIIEGARDVTIVDDTANASPEAVKAGLDMLKPFAGDRRVVAILGTMNELGDYSETSHQEVAAYAADKVDFLVLVGKYADTMHDSAVEAGLPAVHILTFANPEQLTSQLNQVVQRRDVVYLKASQNGMRFERVVKVLMLHPELASEQLVRQGKEWKN